jgi:DnaJ homolog subfamily C member 28
MDEFENPIDKILREARERGEFDNLPGKGRPIRWEDETQVPDDQRMAQRLLKHNNFTLDWIELGRELDREYEQARADLEAARTGLRAGKLDQPGWQAARDHFLKKVGDLNQRVIGYNLRIPGDAFARRPYSKEIDESL